MVTKSGDKNNIFQFVFWNDKNLNKVITVQGNKLIH